jgi:hypothetical protein
MRLSQAVVLQPRRWSSLPAAAAAGAAAATTVDASATGALAAVRQVDARAPHPLHFDADGRARRRERLGDLDQRRALIPQLRDARAALVASGPSDRLLA